MLYLTTLTVTNLMFVSRWREVNEIQIRSNTGIVPIKIKAKYPQKMVPQRHFVHQNLHNDSPGIDPGFLYIYYEETEISLSKLISVYRCLEVFCLTKPSTA
jgi:hypothetical protein